MSDIAVTVTNPLPVGITVTNPNPVAVSVDQFAIPGPPGPAGEAGRGVHVYEQTDEPLEAMPGDIWIIPMSDVRVKEPDGAWTSIVGPPGEQGDPGESGGALLAAFWQFNTTITSPPGTGQIRTNGTPGNTLWVAETDTDGMDRSTGLGKVHTGDLILVRAANGSKANWTVSAEPTDNGTWWTIPFTVDAGSPTVTKGSRTQLNFTIDIPVAGIPTGGTDGQVLTKTSSVDYEVAWEAAAPVRRTVKADTTTGYTPVLGDENQMVTLSDASAITVTLPSNTTAAFPIGAEVDFLWLGAGQPTFVAGAGATVNATPGLKLRAQYSAATAKKVSTNGWVVVGDLAA